MKVSNVIEIPMWSCIVYCMRSRMVIPGGSGFLGRTLANWFNARSWDVTILSRTGRAISNATVLRWDGESPGDWTQSFNGATAVINLAGRSVNCRYNAVNREQIYQSRLRSTRLVGQAIADAKQPPAVWLNASSATIYRHAEDRPMDEATGEIGDGFSVDVVQKWEAELNASRTPATRKIALRAAMVMGPGADGVFEAFYGIVRKRLGGTLGSGRQFVSWIHVDDFCRAIEFLIESPAIDGAVNLAAPNPIPNHQFMRELREAAGIRIGLPAAKWMLEIGALLLGTETELLLKSRRVVPGRLQQAGFTFNFPEWKPAALDIIRRR